MDFNTVFNTLHIPLVVVSVTEIIIIERILLLFRIILFSFCFENPNQ